MSLMSLMFELQSRCSAPVHFFNNLAVKKNEDNLISTGNVGHRTQHTLWFVFLFLFCFIDASFVPIVDK